jgi:hypothetical protein
MEYNKDILGSELHKGIGGLENLATMFMEGVKESPIASFVSPEIMDVVEDILRTSFGDKQNLDMEKLFAAGVVIAQELGVLPEGLSNTSPQSIASLANEVFTRVKVAYQTGEGIIGINEATDILIDMAAARAIPILDAAVEQGVPMAIEGICAALAEFFPPAIEFAPYISEFVSPFLTEPAKQLVHKGVEILKGGAKVVVRTATEKILKVGQRVGKKLLSLI